MASSHIARVTAGGVSDRRIAHSLYGVCTTAATVADKEVNLYTGASTTADGTWSSDDLFNGLTISVRFKYSNTSSSTATLNVNGSGAKPIYRYGTTSVGEIKTTSWQAQEIVTFTYDNVVNSSGCWIMNRGGASSGLSNLIDANATGAVRGVNSSSHAQMGTDSFSVGYLSQATGTNSFAEGYAIRQDHYGLIIEGKCAVCGEKIARACD